MATLIGSFTCVVCPAVSIVAMSSSDRRHRADATVEALVQRASAQQRAGDPAAAAQSLRQATQQFPDDWRPFTRLGALLAEHHNWDGAATCFAEASRLQPGNADIAFNLGTSLREAGRLDDAIGAFERAAGLNPAYGGAYLGLGLTYRLMGAADAAVVAFNVAEDTLPGDPRPLREAARTQIDAGQVDAALATLKRMAERLDRSADAHNIRGLLLQELGLADDAFAAFTRAADIDPKHVGALNNRGSLLLLNRRFSDAISDFDRVLAIQPEVDGLRSIRLYAAMHVFDWARFDEDAKRLAQDIDAGQHAVQPLVVQTVLDDPQRQQRASWRWMRDLAVTDAAAAAAAAEPAGDPTQTAGRRIKVAYVSRDFRSHPVSFLMAEVIELHDRAAFEVIAINYGDIKDDAMQQRLRGAFDAFHDVARLSDAEVAGLCRQLGVDIAVDLTGFTDGARPGIFAARAAPVQMLYLGFLGTSGSKAYDYLVADPVLIPEAERSCFDERLLMLPWYQANDRQRPMPSTGLTRKDVGLAEDAVVLCCFNNPCKILPDQFARWAAILRDAPRAVLWILEEDAEAALNLRRHAEAQGVDPERIVLAPRASRELYVERLALADLFLDTLPYNAGTTASDALWMGVPVLTLPGRSFPARMAASLLTALGCEELIARDAADYVAKAIALASDEPVLAQAKQTVRDARLTGRLFNSEAFTRHLEQGLRRVHAHRLAGHAPEDQWVEASI